MLSAFSTLIWWPSRERFEKVDVCTRNIREISWLYSSSIIPFGRPLTLLGIFLIRHPASLSCNIYVCFFIHFCGQGFRRTNIVGCTFSAHTFNFPLWSCFPIYTWTMHKMLLNRKPIVVTQAGPPLFSSCSHLIGLRYCTFNC